MIPFGIYEIKLLKKWCVQMYCKTHKQMNKRLVSLNKKYYDLYRSIENKRINMT